MRERREMEVMSVSVEDGSQALSPWWEKVPEGKVRGG
jgi:hypothetical protein